VRPVWGEGKAIEESTVLGVSLFGIALVNANVGPPSKSRTTILTACR
jgi:hypothetical protein